MGRKEGEGLESLEPLVIADLVKTPAPLSVVPFKVPENPSRVKGNVIVEGAGYVFNFMNDSAILPEQKIFLVHFLEMGTITHAAMRGNLDPRIVAEWKKNADFMLMLKHCEEVIADELERVALLGAVRGNDKLLIALLKAMKPDKYAERKQVTGKDGEAVQISWTTLVKRVGDFIDVETTGDGGPRQEG